VWILFEGIVYLTSPTVLYKGDLTFTGLFTCCVMKNSLSKVFIFFASKHSSMVRWYHTDLGGEKKKRYFVFSSLYSIGSRWDAMHLLLWSCLTAPIEHCSVQFQPVDYLWNRPSLVCHWLLHWCIQAKIFWFETSLFSNQWHTWEPMHVLMSQILFVTCAEYRCRTLQWNAYLQALNQQCS
jgi:hypothetical protein